MNIEFDVIDILSSHRWTFYKLWPIMEGLLIFFHAELLI